MSVNRESTVFGEEVLSIVPALATKLTYLIAQLVIRRATVETLLDGLSSMKEITTHLNLKSFSALI